MGWMFLYDCPTKADLIEHVTKAQVWTGDDGVEKIQRIVKHTLVGPNLWCVAERIEGGVLQWRTIFLFLTRKEKGVGWGYKDMDESMGPNEVNCPLSYLSDLTEARNEWAREWRESVRAYHARRAKKLEHAKGAKPGDTVRVYGKEYVVEKVLPRGIIHAVRDGMTYKIRSQQLTIA